MPKSNRRRSPDFVAKIAVTDKLVAWIALALARPSIECTVSEFLEHVREASKMVSRRLTPSWICDMEFVLLTMAHHSLISLTFHSSHTDSTHEIYDIAEICLDFRGIDIMVEVSPSINPCDLKHADQLRSFISKARQLFKSVAAPNVKTFLRESLRVTDTRRYHEDNFDVFGVGAM
ncbi:hypothetical protein VKT23_020680 [Stygiomarasmius scandens]|uniref:Uncharacterized protein n=1 Tax=Marasmiellus scandens TaxID=2682957 RepID=A0ABR1IKB7_9AGAR